jgi:hypothetical protein
MTDCTTQSLLFSSLGSKKIQADFNGGSLTSDAGALLPREAVPPGVAGRADYFSRRQRVLPLAFDAVVRPEQCRLYPRIGPQPGAGAAFAGRVSHPLKTRAFPRHTKICGLMPKHII